MIKGIKDLGPELAGKKAVLRGDLDVPLKGGKVGEDYRLKALLPTLNFLLEKGARVLVIGHAGRPKGQPNPSLSLRPLAEWFAERLGRKVDFFPDFAPADSDSEAGVLENLRFWPGEEENDPAFAKELASLGGLYVNDAFAVSHREHASIVGVPNYIPAYAGLRLEEEVWELGGVLENPARPLILVLGGAKTETKAPLVPAFAETADSVLLGGRLMFLPEMEKIPKVVLPVDDLDTFDIGEKSVQLFADRLKTAQTIVWNGPLGKWEEDKYARGTKVIAETLANSPAKTIVGGGDTIAALSAFGLLEKMKYVSMGGGAMLEFLAGRKLPGLSALGYD